MTPQDKANIVLAELHRLFPKVKPSLTFSNNWELLIAVALSAQCTDKKVNEVTDKLFRTYPTLADYVSADLSTFEQDIYQTGFYRAKSKNILAAAKKVQEDFGGAVPNTMEALITIPGVGRKTANVILGAAFGEAVGIAVDTHVKRLAKKFELTSHTDANKIEKDLVKLLPQNEWYEFTIRMIEYGREYSPARKKLDNTDPISLALNLLYIHV